MNSCDNCMFSGWVKDSELLKCHNPLSKDYKTKNPVNFVCPEWTADDRIEEAWYQHISVGWADYPSAMHTMRENNFGTFLVPQNQINKHGEW